MSVHHSSEGSFVEKITQSTQTPRDVASQTDEIEEEEEPDSKDQMQSTYDDQNDEDENNGSVASNDQETQARAESIMRVIDEQRKELENPKQEDENEEPAEENKAFGAQVTDGEHVASRLDFRVQVQDGLHVASMPEMKRTRNRATQTRGHHFRGHRHKSGADGGHRKDSKEEEKEKRGSKMSRMLNYACEHFIH